MTELRWKARNSRFPTAGSPSGGLCPNGVWGTTERKVRGHACREISKRMFACLRHGQEQSRFRAIPHPFTKNVKGWPTRSCGVLDAWAGAEAGLSTALRSDRDDRVWV